VNTLKSKTLRIAAAATLGIIVAYVLDVLVSAQRVSFLRTTPGQYLAQLLIPVPPHPRELSTLGLKIVASVAFDAFVWFLIILGVLTLMRRLFDTRRSTGTK
jgi:hypothetical protein